MKRYIKPTMMAAVIELQQMIATSPGIGDGKGLGTDYTSTDPNYSKGDFYTVGERAENNEYPVFSLWED